MLFVDNNRENLCVVTIVTTNMKELSFIFIILFLLIFKKIVFAAVEYGHHQPIPVGG